MTRRPTAQERDDAAALAAYLSRYESQAERAVRLVVATVLGVLLALALVHWATPCAEATLCSGAGALALPGNLQLWLRHQCRRLHIAVLRVRLQQLLCTAQQMALDDRPALHLASVLAKAASVRLELAHLLRQHAVDTAVRRTVAS